MEPFMRVIKALGLAVVILAALGAAFWHFWLSDQVSYARLATAYGAKSVCSCLHISRLPLDECKAGFTDDVSLVKFSQSRLDGRESVTASVLGGVVSATARHEPGLGCTLVAP
jgi:hypothetical protein